MRRGALALCTGLMLACLMPGSAMAASEVDQKNETAQGAWLGGTYAQTFTAGKAGDLTGVDLYLNPDAAASVDVAIQYIDRKTKAPNDVQKTHGAAVVVPLSGWRHFEFVTPVAVLVGSQLAIVFTMYGGHVVGSTDKYPGGESWTKGPTWVKMGSDDLLFRTYVAAVAPTVAPTVVPTLKATPKPAASSLATSAPTETSAPTDTLTPTLAASASPTPAPTDGAETAAPTATVTPGSGLVSGSGDSSGSILPIVATVGVLAGLSLGGLGFLLLRRRRAPAAG